jgi:hypothetical protein
MNRRLILSMVALPLATLPGPPADAQRGER